MNHLERIERCLSGEIPDKTPIALWRHFAVNDQSRTELAETIINFQRDYDFDLVKSTPASSFCIKDWGVIDEWRGNPEGTREYSNRIINSPDDWLKYRALGENLAKYETIFGEIHVPGEATLADTLFRPPTTPTHPPE